MNYWNNLMETDDQAGQYMISYGEGPEAMTRHELGNFVNEGESVLDVGCGPGHNHEYFKNHDPSITYRGLDYASRFIRANKVKYPEADFAIGDVQDFPEPDKSWDVVIMQDVLEHTNGYATPVAEALRVARKRIIVTFWRLQETEGHINDDGDNGYGAHYDRHEWEDYLDSLNVHWLHHQFLDQHTPPKQRDFYVIDLEKEHGK